MCKVCQLIKDANHLHKFNVATKGQIECPPNYHFMEKSNNVNGYSKAYNCSQSSKNGLTL